MESVSYAFCEAVCAVLRNLGALTKLPPDNSNCGIWKAAAVATAAGRVTVEVDVNSKDGVWSYKIATQNWRNRHSSITFQELKAISRRCIQTSVVDIGNSDVNSHTSTVDEVTEILEYSAQFVNLAQMWISEDIVIPVKNLVRLISPFRNSSFSEICVGIYSKAAERFLRTQLQSESLKKIDINGHRWSDGLRVAIQRFALTKPFLRVCVANDPLAFSLTFIEKLLKKACKVGKFSFAARSDVHFEELRMFDKEMQIHSDDKAIVWRRRDGVEVKISRSFHERRLCIEFSCDN